MSGLRCVELQASDAGGGELLLLLLPSGPASEQSVGLSEREKERVLGRGRGKHMASFGFLPSVRLLGL